jgi:predicted Co/Zn/Cd cation transporter (cation efflux family)
MSDRTPDRPCAGHPRQDGGREQALLRLSIAVTLLVSLLGVGFGLWSGSRSIVFDGVYGLIDVAMTGAALLVSRLILRGEDRRFQYGYWHLEPQLAVLNGMVLGTACVYAMIDGVGGLLAGGHLIGFGPGAAYAGTVGLLGLAMALLVHQRAAGIRSDLLRIDARAWLLGGSLSLALCIGFLIGAALLATPAAHLARYVDSLILALVALALLPIPARTVWNGAAQVLQVAPAELARRVEAVAAAAAARHGFSAHRTHVAEAGRAQFIEIGFVAPARAALTTFADLDRIREEIAADLVGPRPEQWLTIEFTADRRWI